METRAAGRRPWHEDEDWEAQAERRGLIQRERAQVGAFRRDGYLVVEDDRILDALDTDSVW